MVPQPIVIKVGGSLFDVPDLRPRLIQFLCQLRYREIALIPGGGPTVDAIRHLDRSHGLGEEACHWLALRALSLNAHFLAELLREHSAVVSPSVERWPELWPTGKIPILDAYPFALADDGNADHLPHCWDVTSDSIAARVARMLGARRLVLLKSIGSPDGAGSMDLLRHGIVDRFFMQALGQGLSGANWGVEVVNFREWSPSLEK
jgi:aspartokinase-like uncharacterized kinase